MILLARQARKSIAFALEKLIRISVLLTITFRLLKILYSILYPLHKGFMANALRFS